jgi:hypothetical protein
MPGFEAFHSETARISRRCLSGGGNSTGSVLESAAQFLQHDTLFRVKWNRELACDTQQWLRKRGRRMGRRDFLPLSLSIIVEINVFRKGFPGPSLGRAIVGGDECATCAGEW